MAKSAGNETVILSAVRTPIGKMLGALSSLKATELGSAAVKAAVERSGLRTPSEIDEVLMGNVVSAGLGHNPARQCAIYAGLPDTVGAMTLNKVCGSGLKAVLLADQAIRAGDGSLFVAGGIESMSQAPFLVDGRLGQLRYGHAQMRDSLVTDGLWCAFEDWAMGDAAEYIADEFDISREDMDAYALGSHQKAVEAAKSGCFQNEIVPIEVPGRKGEVTVVNRDEGPRPDTSLEALGKLKPVFRPEGRVTAGNAPGLNDAGAALVVASRGKAISMGARPLARIAGTAQAALEPKRIFAAPAAAILRLLDRTGWTLPQVDWVELNEAFAAQVLANGKALSELGWDWNRVNCHGGAIALGHPLGATGARILVTLVHGLLQKSLERGIACLCLGGGEAVAIAIEAC